MNNRMWITVLSGLLCGVAATNAAAQSRMKKSDLSSMQKDKVVMAHKEVAAWRKAVTKRNYKDGRELYELAGRLRREGMTKIADRLVKIGKSLQAQARKEKVIAGMPKSPRARRMLSSRSANGGFKLGSVGKDFRGMGAAAGRAKGKHGTRHEVRVVETKDGKRRVEVYEVRQGKGREENEEHVHGTPFKERRSGETRERHTAIRRDRRSEAEPKEPHEHVEHEAEHHEKRRHFRKGDDWSDQVRQLRREVQDIRKMMRDLKRAIGRTSRSVR